MADRWGTNGAEREIFWKLGEQLAVLLQYPYVWGLCCRRPNPQEQGVGALVAGLSALVQISQ